MTNTRLQLHHIIPREAIAQMANAYAQRFNVSSSEATAWARSIVESPMNQIPLPSRSGTGFRLPWHNGGPLGSYQSAVIARVVEKINTGAIDGVTSEILDLGGALRLGIIQNKIGPNGAATYNALNEAFLTRQNLDTVIANNRATIDGFKLRAVSVPAGVVDWSAYAMGLDDYQLHSIMRSVPPSVTRSGEMLAGVAAEAQRRGLEPPSRFGSWEVFTDHILAPKNVSRAVVRLFTTGAIAGVALGVALYPMDVLAKQIVAEDGVSYPEALRRLGLDPASIDVPALIGGAAVDLVVPGKTLLRIVDAISNVGDIIAIAELYEAAFPDDRNIRSFVEFLHKIKNDPTYAAASNFINAARERGGALFSGAVNAVLRAPQKTGLWFPQVDASAVQTRVYLNGRLMSSGAEIIVYGVPGLLGPNSFVPFDGDPSTFDPILLPGNVQITGSGTSVRDLVFRLDGEVARPIFQYLTADGTPVRYGPSDGAMLNGVVKPPIAYAIDRGASGLGANLIEVHWAVGPRAGQVEVFEGTLDDIVSRLSDVIDGRRSGFFSELAGVLQDISFGQLGSIFGSNLARLLQTSDPWGDLAVGTLLGTVGLNVGQGIENALDDNGLTTFRSAFDDLPTELRDASIGAISSYLFAEWVNDQGLSDFGGGALSATGGAAISQIATNLVNLGKSLNPAYWVRLEGSQLVPILDPVTNAPIPTTAPKPPGAAVRQWNTDVGGAMLNAAGSFLGTYLASKIVQFDTIGGQIGASLGSAIGSVYVAGVFTGAATAGASAIAAGATATTFQSFAIQLGSFAGPVGAFIGAFFGYILGGLIGSLFGGTPKSGAALNWNGEEFQVGHAWAKNGGSKDAVRSMAGQVGELLNGVIAASGSRVTDVSGIQAGAYETKGKRFIYKASAQGNYAFTSKDVSKVVNHGAFIALYDLSERLIGGDVYVKRALSATLLHANGNPDSNSAYSAGDFEAQTLFGNIATAQDYAQYLQNAAVINALIAAEPESAFTAGWTITFARVMELGLDRRWKSDWLGGWAAFLDETADGKIDGSAFAPGNVFLELDPESNERLFVFVDGDGALLGVLGDTIDTASKDVIAGTAGADTLTVNGDTIALTAGLTLNGAAATAGNHKIRVAALLDGGAGDDVIRGGDLGNDLLGGDGADTLIGGKLDDWMFGGAGDDRLYAGQVADPNASASVLTAVDGGNGDYLDGGDGNDALYGGKGSDWLSGGAGVDALHGGAGGDVLDGGEGDDRGVNGEARLLGGEGSDNYVFYYGGGNDVIGDDGNTGLANFAARNRYLGLNAGTIQRNWAGDGDYQLDGSVVGGEDAIAFGPGIGFQDLLLRRSQVSGAAGNDLIIELTQLVNGVRVATGDTLTVKDWFDETRRVEWLRFANGEEIRIGDLSSFIIGTAANDVVIGTAGSDYFVGMGGDDQFYALDGHDFGYGGDGNDLISGDGDNDWVLGGAGDDNVMGGAGNDTVFGDGGNDVVNGGQGHDLIAGGRGDDQITGGAGNDLIKYARGDGRDTVFDAYEATWELVWDGGYTNGFTYENGRVVRSGEVLYDNGDWRGVYEYRDDGRLYRQTSTLVQVANNGVDTLEFSFDIDIQDVQVRRFGDSLQLAVADLDDGRAFDDIADRITLQAWYASQNGVSIENFVFIDIGAIQTGAWNIGALVTDGDDVVAGTSSRDWYTGGLGDDQLSGGDNDDVLVGNNGADRLSGGSGADVLYGGAGDDVLDGGGWSQWAVGDRLFGGAGFDIASYASNPNNAYAGRFVSLATPHLNTLWDAIGEVYDSIEGLEGSSLADVLEGDTGDNLLRGIGGDDELIGGQGDDAYEYEIGHGHDVIRDGVFNTEVLLNEGGGFDPALYYVTFSQVGTIELYGVTWGEFSVTMRRKSGNPFGAANSIVYQSQPGDFLYELPADPGPILTPDPPPGPSIPSPYPDPQSWPFESGQWIAGARRIPGSPRTILDHATTTAAGADSLELGQGVSLSDVSAAWENGGGDLRLSFAMGGSLLLQGQSNAGRAVETLILADGLAGDLTRIRLSGQQGDAGDELFLGGAGADTFSGDAGDDVISGASGDDVLSGAGGDDVLEGGAGADVLNGGADSASSGAALQPGQIAYGDTIRYVRSQSAVSIDLAANTASGGDAAGDQISSIENVIGSDAGGDTLLGTDGANRLSGLGGDDLLNGRGGDDVLSGGAGADTIYAGAGDDNAVGGAGADVLYGEAGDDLILGDDGADTLEGGDGRDRLLGGAGDDVLRGGAGDDVSLAGGEGADTLYGDAGEDTLSGEAGADIIHGGDGVDRIVGGADNDMLYGGAGGDLYIFDAYSGIDQIIDGAGPNRVVIDGVRSDQIWLSRVAGGGDLLIQVEGGAQILVKDHFSQTPPALLSLQVVSGEAVSTLFLKYAAPLIDAMTASAAVTGAITTLRADLWHNGATAAPRVSDQTLSGQEDVALSGAVNAIDHDESNLTYALAGAPAHGVVVLSGGAWTFTPNPDWSGQDKFQIRVSDGEASVVQSIAVTIAAVNDAPRNLGSSSLSVNENAAAGVVVGQINALDVEGHAITYTLVNDAGGRFQLSAGGQLTAATGAALNFEVAASHIIRVRVQDALGASVERDFVVQVGDVNEAPTALTLNNAVTTLAETTPTASRIKVADIAVVDDALGAAVASVAGADAALFEIVAGVLYLKAGALLDFETNPYLDIVVNALDPALGAGASQTFSLEITDVNEGPSAVSFINTTTTLSEAISTAVRIKVADLVITDDALGAGLFALAGADAVFFEIAGSSLYLKAGASLNFETKPAYNVTVTVDDPLIGATYETSAVFTLAIADANEAPTDLAFVNVVSTLSESASTANRTKLADLVLIDDALGAVTLTLSGADAVSFEIVGGALYLRAGVGLNFEAKSSYSVSVVADDPSVGAGPELTRSFALSISDANEAPTSLSLVNTTTTLTENTSTASRIKVADIVVADDALGSETYALSGADAGSFEIIGAVLYLKAGVALNFEAKSSYSVIVSVDDATVGSSPDASQAFTLSISDANEAPTGVSFANTTTTLAENASTASRIKVADIVVADDALGSETYALSGADAGSFEIVGGELYLRAGVALNFEAKSSYSVTVSADDATVGSSPDASQTFTLSIGDANEAPTGVSFANTTTTLAESTSTASRVKVADIVVADDALGSESYALSGADAASFEVIGGALYLRAGVALNFEAKSSYSVAVSVDDVTVGSSPDASQTFTLSISDANEAPTSLSLVNTTTTLTENTSTAGRIKLADIVVADDALGNETYALSGADAGSFEIIGGELYLKAGVALNFEAKASYSVTVAADDATVGASPDVSQTFTLSVANANDAPHTYGLLQNSYQYIPDPEYAPWDQPWTVYWYEFLLNDEDTTAGLQHPVASIVIDSVYNYLGPAPYLTSTTANFAGRHVYVGRGVSYYDSSIWGVDVSDNPPPNHDMRIRITDTSGAWRYQVLSVSSGSPGVVAPVVLDLDGDGVELTGVFDRNIYFDMTGDGVRERTGWVGADDALLAIDRNGDGVISQGAEIAYTGEHSEAISDLEGLRVYDVNQDGFLDANDTSFGTFRVWRDANQDGVSQAGELQSLSQAGVVAINLTLTLTGAPAAGAFDNRIHGHASFVRGDGSTGLVGDVSLGYAATPSRVELGGTVLPPIVFDLDGGGLSLVSRLNSSVRFDADNDGVRQRTGWFAAGEGVLALDRNGDGMIGAGAEISFAQDLPGARTDLEGLRAYDSNENGFFDGADARFGEFLIWQDVNQDGISQADELKSLTASRIAALNLTPRMTGHALAGAQDNVIVAETTFVRTDGSRGIAGDVFLSYDLAPGPTQTSTSSPDPIDPAALAGAGPRIAGNEKRQARGVKNRKADWIADHALTEAGDPLLQRWLVEHSLWGGASRWPDSTTLPEYHRVEDGDTLGAGVETATERVTDVPMKRHIAPATTAARARHRRVLGAADARVLHMVNSMAQFGARDAADLARTAKKRDPRVAEMLTSLPDLR